MSARSLREQQLANQGSTAKYMESSQISKGRESRSPRVMKSEESVDFQPADDQGVSTYPFTASRSSNAAGPTSSPEFSFASRSSHNAYEYFTTPRPRNSNPVSDYLTTPRPQSSLPVSGYFMTPQSRSDMSAKSHEEQGSTKRPREDDNEQETWLERLGLRSSRKSSVTEDKADVDLGSETTFSRHMGSPGRESPLPSSAQSRKRSKPIPKQGHTRSERQALTLQYEAEHPSDSDAKRRGDAVRQKQGSRKEKTKRRHRKEKERKNAAKREA